MFGGLFYIESSTSSVELYEHGGLIVYDPATNIWANTSTPVGARSEGGFVHLTMATDEVLIQFGGRAGSRTVVVCSLGRPIPRSAFILSRMGSDSILGQLPLSDIYIYSIKQSKWFTHSLGSGAVVPTSRHAFCTVVKSAPDGSSYQIYMFGGLEVDPSHSEIWIGPAATSVWVLTIPTFEWIQLSIRSKSAATDPQGRKHPSCAAIGEHYLLAHGGIGTDGFGSLRCDKKANAAFLFDLNTLTWTNEFVPNEGTYEVPSDVISSIGGK